MKRIGATLLGIWLLVKGVLDLALVTLPGSVDSILDKGLPILAIVAGILLLVGK